MTEVGESERPGGAMRRRHIAAATVGNALEFYDFITYAFFAIQIGRAFFPTHGAYASLMLSLATFGAGFITRPIGAVIIGRYADRVGRRPAMMASFTLMGAAIVTLALIPSYKQIGIAAPILAVLARLVQGFSVGGEVGPTTAFLLESASPNRRGLAVSWQGVTQAFAAMAAGLVGLILSSTLPASALETWGWRVAFLLGALTLPVGLWIRRNLPETLHAADPTATPDDGRATWALARQNARIIILALIVLCAGTIGTYTFSYLTTFAQHTLHMKPAAAFLASSIGYSAAVVAGLTGGWLSDRFGRRPLMIWPGVVAVVAVLPVYYWIVHARDVVALAAGSVVLAILGGLRAGPFYAAVTESLPKRIRGGAFAILYALPVAIFGGTTQLVVTWLTQITGNPMAMGWYVFVTLIASLVAMTMIVESAPAKVTLAPVPAT